MTRRTAEQLDFLVGCLRIRVMHRKDRFRLHSELQLAVSQLDADITVGNAT